MTSSECALIRVQWIVLTICLPKFRTPGVELQRRQRLCVIDLINLPPQRVSNLDDTGTVLLHLYVAALYRRFQKRTAIPSLYIPLPSPFPELESFIHESIKTYDLDLFHCLSTKTKEGAQLAVETVMTPASGIPSQPKKGGGEGMKKALEAYKNKFPCVKGILIGTRSTDPYCGMFCSLHQVASNVGDRFADKLGFRNPTDQGWPDFVRINPIINWTFPDVWTFLKKLDVPYCSLYDQGWVCC